MMQRMAFRQRWVLITGASSGLGRAVARDLALHYGAYVLLVARRTDRLSSLRDEIVAQGGKAEFLAADLSLIEDNDRVFAWATQYGSVYAVVLNAGVTYFGHHDKLQPHDAAQLMRLNVLGTAHLLQLFLPYLEHQGAHGGILLVASLAGIMPVAYQALYSGSKAFLINYGCALHHEMRLRGVTVSVCAPGGIDTEMTQDTRFDGLRLWLGTADKCARQTLEGFRRRKAMIIPSLWYRWAIRISRVLPQSLLLKRIAIQYRRSLDGDHRSDLV